MLDLLLERLRYKYNITCQHLSVIADIIDDKYIKKKNIL